MGVNYTGVSRQRYDVVLYSHCSPYQTMHLADIMIKNGENNFQPRALYGEASRCRSRGEGGGRKSLLPWLDRLRSKL